MKWGSITAVFFLSFVKFMFAPFTGAGLKLDFFSTWISALCGGFFSALVFYFMSDYFMKRYQRKKVEKRIKMEALGQVYKSKKNFTKLNKTVIRLKHRIGQYGLCFLAPLFLSVPIGSIICAKFYSHQKNTFSLIVLGLVINSFLLSVLAYKVF
jgi:hypothetical protein|tara:strand:+ start:22770 stop:23231 length:462 start_codon:yes stop_codon:yes gene_type:complete